MPYGTIPNLVDQAFKDYTYSDKDRYLKLVLKESLRTRILTSLLTKGKCSPILETSVGFRS